MKLTVDHLVYRPDEAINLEHVLSLGKKEIKGPFWGMWVEATPYSVFKEKYGTRSYNVLHGFSILPDLDKECDAKIAEYNARGVDPIVVIFKADVDSSG